MNKVYASAYERACDQQRIINALLEAAKAAELHLYDEMQLTEVKVPDKTGELWFKLRAAITLAEGEQ